MTSQNSVHPAVMSTFQGEAVVAANERVRLLERALEALDPRPRIILILRARGFSLEEIGEAFDISGERTRQIETRAITALRATFGEMGVHSLAEIL